jgi:hypothetical protein
METSSLLSFMQIQKRRPASLDMGISREYAGTLYFFSPKALVSDSRLKFHKSGCASEGVSENKNYFYVMRKLYKLSFSQYLLPFVDTI